jgi:peptide/nickel transport system substrate-binding protein
MRNCSANRRGGDLTNSKHPYYMIDLITRSAYSGLLWVDEQLQLHGRAGQGLGATDDKLDTWEFVLHEGVLFHDGREMTATDVASSFKLHLATSTGFSQQIADVTAQGKYKVRFSLKQGNAEFPYVVAEYDTMIMPADDGIDRDRPVRHRHRSVSHRVGRPAAAHGAGAPREVLEAGVAVPGPTGGG